MSLYEKSVEYMENSGISALIAKSNAVLVAFSGGADSTVLLYLLKEYLENKNIRLAAAHLNHMIRGAEADRDQDFCRNIAETSSIPFHTKKIDVPALAKEKNMTVEEAARFARYEFLSDTAASIGENTLIATAHNSTDNLETVIFNMVRGSGTVGMGGIAPIRSGRIIRPLLCFSGDEIREYAKENNIDFVFDSTNADTAYTRNFVRKNIVPAMRKINPAAEEAVLRLGTIARSEADFINTEAEKLICREGIKRKDFEAAHPALRNAALRMLYKKKKGDTDGLSMKNLRQAADFALSGRGRLSLPSLTLFSDSDMIGFADEIPAATEEIMLTLNGKTVPFGKNFAVAVTNGKKEPFYDKNIYNLFKQQSARFDTIYDSIFIRSRRTGDRILAGGMHKKLKKLMCDKNVPLRYREELPIFLSGSSIIWVPSVAISDDSKGTDITMYVFIKKG